MLLMAEYDWFKKYKGSSTLDRGEGYAEIKELWRERCINIFLKFFPKAEGKIAVSDISTPLTTEHYLNADGGGAVGIDVTPARFIDPLVRQRLDVETEIKALYMTGQDSAIIGVTLAQISGVITAFRICGFLSACKIVLHSIF